MNTQTGQSVTADFEDSTWTFEMPQGFIMTAGEFSIVPKEDYDALVYALIEARKFIIEQAPIKVSIQDLDAMEEDGGVWQKIRLAIKKSTT